MPLVLHREATITRKGAWISGIAPNEVSEATAGVRCACGRITTLTSPVTFEDHDPDRADRRSWFRSVHRGACAACAAPLDVELVYVYGDFTITPADREVFSLEAITERGGTLAR